MEPKLSKHLSCFRAAKHNTQYTLLKGNKIETIIMDLSNAFDTLNHNLLLCKLKAYDLNKNALTFIQSYFKNRHQRKKWEINLANGKRS